MIQANLFRACLTGLLIGALGCSSDNDGGLGLGSPDSVSDNQNSGAGAYAYDYLTNDEYTRIYVEVDYMEDDDPNDSVNYGPSEESMAFLIENLRTFCNKPDGIIYDSSASTVIPLSYNEDGSIKTDYTYTELNDLEIKYRDHYHSGTEAVLYFLYVNGRYVLDDGSDTSVIGFAHHGSSMVVFKGVVNAALAAARNFYEKTVVVHEVGHLLGLVTTGIPAVNQDHVDESEEARGSHCTQGNCMMFWQVSPADLAESFLTGQDPQFDQCCRDDVTAAGGVSTSTGQPCSASAGKIEGSDKAEADNQPVEFNHYGDPFHNNVVF